MKRWLETQRGAYGVTALALALAGLAALAVPPATLAAAPTRPAHPLRVVALGLPADELALALVGPERIVALDRFADDPRASNVIEEARSVRTRVPVRAEAIAPQEPDLVLVPAWAPMDLEQSLHALAIPTLRLDTPSSIADVRATIRTVAAALDAAERGEALVRAMDASLERTRARATGPRVPTVLLDSGSGFSPGRGTLLAELTHIAGGELLFDRLGREGLVPLSLEHELALDPDVLWVDAYRADARARSVTSAMRGAHGLDPRLSGLRAVRSGAVHAIDARYLLTTTHHVARTAEALADSLAAERAP
ncbi:MAG: ABC transporter substrate-binding protein [Sandaracinus sp.]